MWYPLNTPKWSFLVGKPMVSHGYWLPPFYEPPIWCASKPKTKCVSATFGLHGFGLATLHVDHLHRIGLPTMVMCALLSRVLFVFFVFFFYISVMSTFVPFFASCFVYLLFVSFGRRFDVTTSMKASDVNIAFWWYITHPKSLSESLLDAINCLFDDRLGVNPTCCIYFPCLCWFISSSAKQHLTKACARMYQIRPHLCNAKIDIKKHWCMLLVVSSGFLLLLSKYNGTPPEKMTQQQNSKNMEKQNHGSSPQIPQVYSLEKTWMIHQPEISWCSLMLKCLFRKDYTNIFSVFLLCDVASTHPKRSDNPGQVGKFPKIAIVVVNEKPEEQSNNCPNTQ